LFRIGCLYVSEAAAGSLPRSSVSAAVRCLGQLIIGGITYDEACAACLSYVRTAEPARRIHAILGIARGSAAPAPPMPKNLSRRCRLWTPDDDARLLAGIHRYGLGDWKRIAQFVGNDKSSGQCSQRWSRAINPSLRKEQWTPHEDEDLCELVKRIGTHNWAKVAQHMESRSDVQCRYRFQQLRKTRRFGDAQPVSAQSRFMQNPLDVPQAELVPPLVIRVPQNPPFF
jgi:hypothetical protein